MKNGLFILLIFCFSLTIISCSDEKEEYSATGTTDNTTSTTTDDTTNSSGLFVSVGESGTILTSSDDGITWTSRTSGTSSVLKGVTYGNSIFVTVGASGTILTLYGWHLVG